MKILTTALCGLSLLAASAVPSLSASHENKEMMMKMMAPMIGKWSWNGFVIENKVCDTNPAKAGMCATVISGPKNVGMEMIRSPLAMKDQMFVGQVAHPMTGEVYNSKMSLSQDMNTWHMEGCTDANACAQGDFVRMQ